MIKPWIFEFFNAFEDGEDDFAWYLDLWQSLETKDFEGIFFSEHHFYAGRLSPSPNLLIAATAARTRTLRLGAMGQVLPLHEPFRVAEEAFMLDRLCGGRYEMGFSSGSGPMEFKALGIAADDIRPRFDEALQVIEAAIAQPQISHHGRFYHYDNLNIAPRPLRASGPSRWITGLSDGSARSAGARGYKYCTGFLSVESVKALHDAFRAGAQSAGRHVTADDFALRRHVCIGDNDAEARDVGETLIRKTLAIFSGNHAARARGYTPPKAAVADAPRVVGFLSPEESIAGDVDSVAEQIIDQCRRTGAGHIVAYPFADLSRQQTTRNYELWEQVIPVLRRANIE